MSIVLLISRVFHHTDFVFLHQGYFHLCLCFVISCMLSSLPRFHHAAFSCHLASLSGCARLSLVIRVLKFPCFHFSPRHGNFPICSAQICNFLLSVCHHILSLWVFFYHFKNQVNRFQMDQWDCFSFFVPSHQRIWKHLADNVFCAGLKYSLMKLNELITVKHH